MRFRRPHLQMMLACVISRKDFHQLLISILYYYVLVFSLENDIFLTLSLNSCSVCTSQTMCTLQMWFFYCLCVHWFAFEFDFQKHVLLFCLRKEWEAQKVRGWLNSVGMCICPKRGAMTKNMAVLFLMQIWVVLFPYFGSNHVCWMEALQDEREKVDNP